MTQITCAATADTFRCPTKWELWGQVLALLPRGRAWQSHESVAEFLPGVSATYGRTDLGGDVGAGADGGAERLTVLQQYWAAFAEVSEFLHQRACALIDEMFCESVAELRSEWGADYGFPDSCDPWPTLCDKVRAQGGTTCAYFSGLAASLGFSADCINDCNGVAGCMPAGCLVATSPGNGRIHIRITASESPAMTTLPNFAAGALVAGCTPPCPPVPDQIICLIERFKPAHVVATYEVVP